MKRINKLWALVSVLGLVLAICTADGSNYELGIRFCGIAAFGIGAYLGGFMDLNKKEDKQ